jgi:hypothetical protein
MDITTDITTLVVISRSAGMSEDDRRRLLNLNYNRRVQLITYDDLVTRIEQTVIAITAGSERIH